MTQRAAGEGSRKLLFVIATAGALATACGSDSSQAERRVSEIEGPAEGVFEEVAWAADGEIIAMFDQEPDISAQRPTPWALDLATSDWRPLDFGDDPSCRHTDYFSPAVLADGRIGLSVACRRQSPIDNEHRVELRTADHRGRTVVLDGLQFRPHVAWAPDGSRATISENHSLCAAFALLDAEGHIEALDVSVGAWNLAAAWESMRTSCEEGPRAAFPSWSNDGRSIAFVGSPPSGSEGFDRLSDPWALFVLNVDDADARRIIDDLIRPSWTAWSPDGSRIAVSGTRNGEAGLWTVDVATRHVEQLAAGDWTEFAWSPKGTCVVGIVRGTESQLRFVVIETPLEASCQHG